MSDYRRYYQPGGTSFFTIVTYHRFRLFAEAGARDLLGEVMRDVRAEMPFETVAMVLLPEHLHAIWALTSGDADYSTRWKEIKSRFTSRWLAQGGREMPVTESQRKRGGHGIWQRRFIEHLVRDTEDLENHIHYVHFNPVKHGHVSDRGTGRIAHFAALSIEERMPGIGEPVSRRRSARWTTNCRTASSESGV